MKFTLTTLIVAGLLSSANLSFGQAPVADVASGIVHGNIIKTNLTADAFKYFNLQYERVITPLQSIGFQVSVASNVGLPFAKSLTDLYGDNEEAINAINSTTFSQTSLTLEYRFYFGPKGAPIGFYTAPMVRYVHMNGDWDYLFHTNSGSPHTPHVTGDFNGFGAGAMIGVQWMLGKSMTLDWWIVGPFAGPLKGTFHGTDDFSDVDTQDQSDLEGNIEATNIPGWTIDATVTGASTENGTIDVNVTGLYLGSRFMGICLGFRF